MYYFTVHREYAYGGVWHLFTPSERSPLGFDAATSAQLNALSKLSGVLLHAVFGMKDGPLGCDVVDLTGRLYGRHAFDERDYVHDIVLLKIDVEVKKEIIAEYMRHLDSVFGTAVMDVNALVTGKKHTPVHTQYVALLTPLGHERFRLLCNMHTDTPDDALPLFSCLKEFRCQTDFQTRVLRNAGHVAAPVSADAVLKMPLGFMEAPWTRIVKNIANTAFLARLNGRLNDAMLTSSRAFENSDAMRQLLCSYEDANEENVTPVQLVFDHAPDATGTLQLNVTITPYKTALTWSFTSQFLELLFPAIDARPTTTHSGPSKKSDERVVSLYALVGEALHMAMTTRAIDAYIRLYYTTRHAVPPPRTAGFAWRNVEPDKKHLVDAEVLFSTFARALFWHYGISC